MSRRFHLFLSFALLLGGLLLARSVNAQVVVTSYHETGNLGANDDDYSGPIELGFSMNFGGSTYTQTYVSNNGYITFGEGSGAYSPASLDASYGGLPIIAAFFADVDTRNASSGIVSWGTGLVDGNAAFVAKWPSVGEYPPTNNFTPNSFEIVLVNRSDLGAGNFDVYFNYQQITWDHGGAVAGFHGGFESGLYFQLDGSMQSGAFLDGASNSLTLSSNAGNAGSLLLQSRGDEFIIAPISVPEPSTYALMALGAGMLIFFNRHRFRRG